MSIVTYPAYEEQGKQTWKVKIRKRNQMPWRPKLGDQKRIRRLDKIHQIISIEWTDKKKRQGRRIRQ